MTNDAIAAIISVIALVMSISIAIFVVIRLKREEQPPESDKSWVYVDEDEE